MADSLGSKIGAAFIEVGAAISPGFGKGLGEDVANAILSQSLIVGQALEGLGQAVFTRFSVPLLAAGAANIAQFQALDREIRTVLTLFGTAPSLVEDTFSEMASGIRDVSKEVGGLEKDIAGGLYQAISAGVPRGGVFDFLEVAQMAAIADKTADLTSAVDGLTNVVNAFGLEAADAGRIADVMFTTVALGKTTFGELSEDIGRVAPLAANAGVSFEELFAIIGSLTLQGLKTSEAISFLRAAITGLLRPTDELNAAFFEFGSAEAAIPVIGLQGAFQKVFEAVGGSTSAMQELIGTSEGVSAILGVTGDNADTFGRIMDSTAISTGSMSTAFAIMDDSVGRSFGRLTEAFDRLGNTFGEMAAQFVTPVLGVATDIIDNMVGIFENFRPLAEGLGVALGQVFSILNLPILKDVAAVFAAIAVTISGLIGGLGLFVLTFGKVLIAGYKLSVVTTIVKNSKDAFIALQAASTAAGVSLAGTQVAATKAGGAMGLLGKTTRGISNLFLALGTSVPLAVGATLAVVAAIGGLVAAFAAAKKAEKDYIEAHNTLGKSLDKLIESSGLVDLGIGNIGEAAEESLGSLALFERENLNLVNSLRSTKDLLGEIAATQIGEAVVAELLIRGNPIEDVQELIGYLNELAGVEIDIDLTGVEDVPGFLTGQLAEGLLSTADLLAAVTDEADAFAKKGKGFEDAFNLKELTAEAMNLAEGFVDLFKQASDTGDIELFNDTLQEVVSKLDPAEVEAFATALRRAFEDPEVAGFEVNIIDGILQELAGAEALLEPGELTRRLAAAGITSIGLPVDLETNIDIPDSDQLATTVAEFENLLNNLDVSEQTRALEEFGLSFFELADPAGQGASEVLAILDNLASGTATAFDKAQSHVVDSMAEITNSIQSQIPFVESYVGKVELTFAEFLASQTRFQEDLKAVTALRGQLIEDQVPQDIIDAFDQAPITQQAWLAALGPENLDKALETLAATHSLADQAATDQIAQSMTTILGEATAIIDQAFIDLTADAVEAGGAVPEAFLFNFNLQAAKWPTAAATWVGLLRDELNVFIPGPRIGAPTFTPVNPISPGSNYGTGGYGGTVIINNPVAESPEASAEKASAIMQTSNFFE